MIKKIGGPPRQTEYLARSSSTTDTPRKAHGDVRPLFQKPTCVVCVCVFVWGGGGGEGRDYHDWNYLFCFISCFNAFIVTIYSLSVVQQTGAWELGSQQLLSISGGILSNKQFTLTKNCILITELSFHCCNLNIKYWQDSRTIWPWLISLIVSQLQPELG